MKQAEVQIGGWYYAKVSGRIAQSKTGQALKTGRKPKGKK